MACSSSELLGLDQFPTPLAGGSRTPVDGVSGLEATRLPLGVLMISDR
jgi:hypothetical protein